MKKGAGNSAFFHVERKKNMIQYIYPQNLKATTSLWLWSLRDFAITCVALLIPYWP